MHEEKTRQEVGGAKLRRFWIGWLGRLVMPTGWVHDLEGVYPLGGDLAADVEGTEREGACQQSPQSPLCPRNGGVRV